MNNDNDNIMFFFEEKTEETDNTIEIEKMLYELENTENVTEDIIDYNNDFKQNNVYYEIKEMYKNKYGINNEEFYQEYTVKELLRICDYYDIEKYVKSAKCKKLDIISSIVYFESLPENAEIVNRRHTVWCYIMELIHDPKMKKYVIWS